jgi:hypothetical protein
MFPRAPMKCIADNRGYDPELTGESRKGGSLRRRTPTPCHAGAVSAAPGILTQLNSTKQSIVPSTEAEKCPIRL